jgi:hypothetical protein
MVLPDFFERYGAEFARRDFSREYRWVRYSPKVLNRNRGCRAKTPYDRPIYTCIWGKARKICPVYQEFNYLSFLLGFEKIGPNKRDMSKIGRVHSSNFSCSPCGIRTPAIPHTGYALPLCPIRGRTPVIPHTGYACTPAMPIRGVFEVPFRCREQAENAFAGESNKRERIREHVPVLKSHTTSTGGVKRSGENVPKFYKLVFPIF